MEQLTGEIQGNPAEKKFKGWKEILKRSKES